MRKRILLPGFLMGVLVAGAPWMEASGMSINGVGFALDNGDTNGNLKMEIGDAIYLLSHIYLGGPPPVPLALCGGEDPAVVNGDINGDGHLDIADPVGLLGWLYTGGSAPVHPCFYGSGGGRSETAYVRTIPPQAKPLGMSYGDWAGVWWQWSLTFPVPENPFLIEECVSEDQPGKVFFLAGAIAADPPIVRECTVPKGAFLFFPIINTECSNLEPPGGCDPEDPECDDSFFCDDEESCIACNNKFYSAADDILSLTVDGVEIKKLTRFRATSGIYDVGPLPEDNLLGVPAGTTGISLADGYYVMIAPLSKGDHMIEFRGCMAGFGGCEGFEILVVYEITVE